MEENKKKTEPVVRYGVDFPESMHQAIKIEAARRRISIRQFIMDACARDLARREGVSEDSEG